jgi:hypothetical protein
MWVIITVISTAVEGFSREMVVTASDVSVNGLCYSVVATDPYPGIQLRSQYPSY